MEDRECTKMVLASFLPRYLSDSDMDRLAKYVELVKRDAYFDGYTDGVFDTARTQK